MYYPYHATAKKLIREGHCTKYEIKNQYQGISPCMILYFDNHIPMAIRSERWEEYFPLLNRTNDFFPTK